MERFFTPTRRLRPIALSGYSEVQLAESIEAFMNHGWDWADFRAFVTGGDEGSKYLWITEDTCTWVEDENTE